MDYITVTYAIKYVLNFAPHYKWLENDRCYNVKTGRFIKQVYNNRCIGYVINGKFKSLTHLRKHLVKPKINKCPFKN